MKETHLTSVKLKYDTAVAIEQGPAWSCCHTHRRTQMSLQDHPAAAANSASYCLLAKHGCWVRAAPRWTQRTSERHAA